MSAAPELDVLVVSLDNWISTQHENDTNASLDELHTELVRLAEMAQGDAGALELPDDLDAKITKVHDGATAIDNKAWSAAMDGYRKESEGLGTLLGERLTQLHQAAENIGQAYADDTSKMMKAQETAIAAATKTAEDLLGEPKRFAEETASHTLAEARTAGQQIADGQAAAAARAMQSLYEQLCNHEAMARSVLERAMGALSVDVSTIEASLRERLDSALRSLADEVVAAIQDRAVEAVEAELQQALEAIAIGTSLTTALSTGPWIPAIHAAKIAIERL